MKPKSEVSRNFFESLPEDLLLDILMRLSVKSLAKLRGAAKRLGPIVHHPDFTERFFTRSCALPPKLLFVRRERGELFFFSAPQPQDLEENSPPLIVDSRMKLAFPAIFEKDLFAPLAGLVCFRDDRCLGKRKTPELVTSICNPSTGECLLLRKMNTSKRTGLVSFFGYDPVGKLHKVLGMIDQAYSTEHQVLTLGGEAVWRRIECGIRHYHTRTPASNVICINGVIYYSAVVHIPSARRHYAVVCFDVRAETFSFIEPPPEFYSVVRFSRRFFDYGGKFAAFRPTELGFELCVLQDSENREWLKLVYELPPPPPPGNNRFKLEFWGMIGTNVVVLSSRSGCDPFYIYYYNTETQTLRRAAIQGIGQSRNSCVYIFINHVENVKFMRAIQN